MVQAEQGYLIPAWNIGDVDYIRCAIDLAKSLRAFHPDVKICLLTNQSVSHAVFDYVHVVDQIATENPWANDWRVFFTSPFRETIKLEADMLVASNIDHWWTLFRHRDVVISTGCRNWYDQKSLARTYRKVFDENNLPDVYNAITYWRLSQTAKDFFILVRDIFDQWPVYSRTIKFADAVPSTDLVYAMAAEIIGRDKVTMPFANYPQIVHMKKHHAGTVIDNWSKELVWELDPLRINTVAQWGLFHYHVKDWQP